jgi:hypothetical protein
MHQPERDYSGRTYRSDRWPTGDVVLVEHQQLFGSQHNPPARTAGLECILGRYVGAEPP